MKWVNYPKDIDYNLFLEGNQIANHIQNISIIATKTGLLLTLIESLKKSNYLFSMPQKIKNFNIREHIPETYILNIANT